ncbi:hypothetical protein SELMODRAFT_425691 [Selaginella moellendorffii]|uniref:PHD-type domain-containing protein n=1 Tax=Selaginella moellendorffii TaxID=88036 RepID=D8STZ1_SELML|nr:hypothetical protein SELMODRAFT_425691 [Selaginella moellendorffii]
MLKLRFQDQEEFQMFLERANAVGATPPDEPNCITSKLCELDPRRIHVLVDRRRPRSKAALRTLLHSWTRTTRSTMIERVTRDRLLEASLARSGRPDLILGILACVPWVVCVIVCEFFRDACKPEKRARCDEWSFAETSNPSRDGEAAPQGALPSSPRLEQQPLDTDRPEDKSFEKEKSCEQDGDECRTSKEKETPAEAAADQKSLRHFSRARQPKARVSAAEASAPQQGAENPSDASSTSLENNNVHKEAKNRRYDLRHSYVDIYQIPEELRCFVDEEEEEEELPDKKAKIRRRSRQEKSSKTRLNKDKVEMIEECLNFMEQMGLFKSSVLVEESSVVAVHPGSVGDGSATAENCRVCGRPGNANSTLVCDTCEETYHLSCCYPRIRSVPRDDRWLCSFCTRKRKKKTAELKIFPAGHFEEKLPAAWKIDKTKVRGWDLQRMERTQVRVGDEFQAVVPEWCGKVSYEDVRPDYPGLEAPRSLAEKLKEKDQAEQTVAANIWPMGWIPARSLPENERENWVQCQNIIYEEGDYLPSGEVANKDIVCGKWRRYSLMQKALAPLHIVADDGWECSCAVAWDPRHADCAVPQEIPTEEIRKRPKARMQSPGEEWKNSGRRGRANQNMTELY